MTEWDREGGYKKREVGEQRRMEGGVGEEKHTVRNKVNKRARNQKVRGNGGAKQGSIV